MPQSISTGPCVNVEFRLEMEGIFCHPSQMKWLPLLLLLGLCLCIHATEQATFIPRTMAYVLQADRLAKKRTDVVVKLAQSGRDLIVLDAVYNSEANGAWTQAEIQKIRAGKPGRRVVAYVFIGEAEDYRPYWQKHWDANKDGKPDATAPAFLNFENPDWKGNYRVRYWQKDWQDIMLPAVDEVVAQGFDGIYLDIVDAYEFYEYDPATKDWRDNLVNPETGNTYRRDMIAWVSAIAQRARVAQPGFLVIPQNASSLLEHEDYRAFISGIGIEDLFVKGKKLASAKESAYVIGFLEKLRPIGKPVLVIDYPQADGIKAAVFKKASDLGYTLLITDRNLTTLGESHPARPVRMR